MDFWVRVIVKVVAKIQIAIEQLDLVVQNAAINSFYDTNDAVLVVGEIYKLMDDKSKLLELYSIYKQLMARCDTKDKLLVGYIAGTVVYDQVAQQDGLASGLVIQATNTTRKQAQTKQVGNALVQQQPQCSAIVQAEIDKVIAKLATILKSWHYTKSGFDTRYLALKIVKSVYSKLKRQDDKAKKAKEAKYVEIGTKPADCGVRSLRA